MPLLHNPIATTPSGGEPNALFPFPTGLPWQTIYVQTAPHDPLALQVSTDGTAPSSGTTGVAEHARKNNNPFVDDPPESRVPANKTVDTPKGSHRAPAKQESPRDDKPPPPVPQLDMVFSNSRRRSIGFFQDTKDMPASLQELLPIPELKTPPPSPSVSSLTSGMDREVFRSGLSKSEAERGPHPGTLLLEDTDLELSPGHLSGDDNTASDSPVPVSTHTHKSASTPYPAKRKQQRRINIVKGSNGLSALIKRRITGKVILEPWPEAKRRSLRQIQEDKNPMTALSRSEHRVDDSIVKLVELVASTCNALIQARDAIRPSGFTASHVKPQGGNQDDEPLLLDLEEGRPPRSDEPQPTRALIDRKRLRQPQRYGPEGDHTTTQCPLRTDANHQVPYSTVQKF